MPVVPTVMVPGAARARAASSANVFTGVAE
jgi:hypothetical protein